MNICDKSYQDFVNLYFLKWARKLKKNFKCFGFDNRIYIADITNSNFSS